MAEEFSSELYVMHVIKNFPTAAAAVQAGVAFDIDAFKEHLSSERSKRLRRLVDERVTDRTESHRIVVHGDPAEELLKAARKERIDLIVIASRGESVLRRLMLGSVTEKVLRESDSPVLVIRSED